MPGVVPRIYRVPEGTLVRGGVGRQERAGGGRNAPMANTQTDEFIKTMTANRAQLAKAGHHKEVWFYERRQREGEREMLIGRGSYGKGGGDWLGSRKGGVI